MLPFFRKTRLEGLSKFIVSNGQRMELRHPRSLQLASYRDGAIAVKNVTKNYAPVLKAIEGVEPSEASNPRPS